MSSNQKCPSCGGHKPALMACRDCGFTYTVTSRPPAAAKPVTPVAKSVPRSEYRAVMEEGGPKSQVVIKTKKRRTYTIPSEE
ncbi:MULTISPECIES: hypothetical protein [unclassified Agarivorans]|uniref:hypothetical protein n=1 Tax=unclassified Agarivorans TaxID=2636026 RepID=UPI0010D63424|nr:MULTISPECIES: hypothetical protein [unclassified Agarivorans]MDO6686325.1 hypothetical protein [Agarivorans sp. 3_MG-2023]MDO6713627.1 hypothetical protein [Agarivorans sp. 2_MG-2023]MDO6761948.1 hypothetical protein [Agarivorans sp. 1_MG-2023]GDY25919.1 hypothetical protein AHAT_18090 [Agarivorans sp. Toyoura001]